MTGLPRSIIKKYGVSKKAWRVFRGRKRKRRAHTTLVKKHRKRRRIGMARRRRRRSYRRSGTSTNDILIGTILGSFASPMVAGFSPLIRAAGGYFLGKKQRGMIKIAALTIAASAAMEFFKSGGLGNLNIFGISGTQQTAVNP